MAWRCEPEGTRLSHVCRKFADFGRNWVPKWTLEQHGDAYRFKNAATGLFIDVNGEPKNFAPIIASTKWSDWEIRPDHHDPSTFRYVHEFNALACAVF